MDARTAVRGLTQERRWGVLVLDQDLDTLLDGKPPTGSLLVAPEPDRFWADPFPVRDRAGRLWVFAEEMHRWRGVGRIVALQIADGEVVRRETVLAGRHHFSFPQVHLVDGTWVATVETCDPLAPAYTFNAPGDEWVASLRTLPVGVVDPALAIPPAVVGRGYDHEEGEAQAPLWYLTGVSGSDPVAGYRQWCAEDGVGWEEQPFYDFRDPVLARPAGNADLVRGIRSVQDCDENYGVAVSVVSFDPTRRGPGEVLRRFDAATFGRGALGAHTLSWTPDGTTVVADVWQRGPQVFSGAHRALEERHRRICRGRRASRAMR